MPVLLLLLQLVFGLDVLVWSMLLPVVVGWHVSSTRYIQAQAGALHIGTGSLHKDQSAKATCMAFLCTRTACHHRRATGGSYHASSWLGGVMCAED